MSDSVTGKSSAAALRDLPYFTGANWNPPRSADYGFDCAIGRSAAQSAIDLAREAGNPTIIAAFLRAIVESGTVDAVEIGALHRIAETAMR